MALKPQDIMVAFKLLVEDGREPSYAALAADLGMSASEVHAAIRRLQEGQLVAPGGRRVQRQALRDLLVHGISHVFPAREQEPSRGIPTAWAAPVFQGSFSVQEESGPVWPHPKGTVRGPSVAPLYKSAPTSALADSRLYDLLSLVDAIRLGRARERQMAVKKLDELLLGDG